MDCFDGVFHEFQAVCMGLDCRVWHAASTGCQHSKGDNDPIVACGSVVVKTGHVVFEYPTEVCGQLCQHDGIGCFLLWGGSMLSIVEKIEGDSSFDQPRAPYQLQE